MSISRSELREKIMTILYQVEMYNKNKYIKTKEVSLMQ